MSWRDGLTIKEIADQFGLHLPLPRLRPSLRWPLVRLRCRRGGGRTKTRRSGVRLVRRPGGNRSEFAHRQDSARRERFLYITTIP